MPIRLLHPWDSPGRNTGVGCHFLLQGIFPTQGLNLGLLHCRQMLYHLSHQGSPCNVCNLPQIIFLSSSWDFLAYLGRKSFSQHKCSFFWDKDIYFNLFILIGG